MAWISENKILFAAVIISAIIHIFIFSFPARNQKPLQPRVVSFEILASAKGGNLVAKVAKPSEKRAKPQKILENRTNKKSVKKKATELKQNVPQKNDRLEKTEAAENILPHGGTPKAIDKSPDNETEKDFIAGNGLSEGNTEEKDIMASGDGDMAANDASGGQDPAAIYEKANFNIIRDMILSRIVYPPRAKKLGIEGSGYLIIIIDNTGAIVSVEATDFPNKMLGEAALKAAQKIGQVAGHRLTNSVELKIPVNFYLR